MVDDAEDDPECRSLLLSNVGAWRISTRVWDIDNLRVVDVSHNRLAHLSAPFRRAPQKLCVFLRPHAFSRPLSLTLLSASPGLPNASRRSSKKHADWRKALQTPKLRQPPPGAQR